ncbi:acetyltransferase component of pyruvate dehydrogenase complex [Planctomycetia bacterium]|nr:acetyltransferase component of pyruvate dehydrogenase complex [Planctomycetia bacterium]
MAIEFKLPEVSEGVTSVDVAEIRVKEGDVIEAGAIICEVETDKAVAEIPCPHAGRITRLLISSGMSISPGTTILEIETANAGAAAAAPAKPAAPAAAAPTPPPAAPAATAAPAAPATAPTASAPFEFRLPEVSEGVAKVDVASVAVKVGDTIAKGAVVCEVETDKAVAEIPSPVAGKVTAVHVSAGSSMKIGDLLLTIEAVGSTAAAPVVAPAAQAPVTPAAPPIAAPAAPAAAPAAATGSDAGPPAPAGPATRRLARKLGVNLRQVKGSAAGGRITIEDIEAFVRERMTQPAVPAAAAAAPGFGIVQAAPLPDFSRFGPVEKQPMNKIFRTAASNLHAAWVTIPHVTQHDLADITELETARRKYVKANPNAPKITMTAIIIKAVVQALKAFPNFNSSVDMASGELVIKQYYHIGVAVDTPNGLVVPVIRNCDQKNILQVAAELAEIAGRARDRKLKAEDMQGGTFTITNLGGIGGTAFTPIVNYPEVAILGMSRTLNHLILENGQLAERQMLPLSLSYDHRAINGADAARFIVKLSGSLTNFLELF